LKEGVKRAKIQQKLSFSIVSKNLFNFFIRKIRKMEFLTLQLIEFDSFNDQFVEERRQTIRKTIKTMKPETHTYETFSLAKGGWKAKKLTKKMTIDPNGEINILWETEDIREQFFIADIYQIIWTDIS
jgi:hypothetical protein